MTSHSECCKGQGPFMGHFTPNFQEYWLSGLYMKTDLSYHGNHILVELAIPITPVKVAGQFSVHHFEL